MVKNYPANAGDTCSIPGSGRSLEKEMITHSSILAWETHGKRSLAGYSPEVAKESDTTERLNNNTQKNAKFINLRCLVFLD